VTSPAERFGCPVVECHDPMWCLRRDVCKVREEGMHPKCDRPDFYDRGQCCGRYPCAALESPTPSRAERGEGHE
jgi:hypothetical protein